MKYLLLTFLFSSCTLGEYGILAYIETLNVSKDSNLPKQGAASTVAIANLPTGARYFLSMGKLFWRDAASLNWEDFSGEAQRTLDLVKIDDSKIAVSYATRIRFLDPSTRNWIGDIALPSSINALFYLAPNIYVHTGSPASYQLHQIAPDGTEPTGFSSSLVSLDIGSIHLTTAAQHVGNDYFLQDGVMAYHYDDGAGVLSKFTSLPTDKNGFTGLMSWNNTLYISMGATANSASAIYTNTNTNAHSSETWTDLLLPVKNYKALIHGEVGGTGFVMAAVESREIAFFDPGDPRTTFSLYSLPSSYLLSKDSSNKLQRLLSYDAANARVFFSTDREGMFSVPLSLVDGKVSIQNQDWKHE